MISQASLINQSNAKILTNEHTMTIYLQTKPSHLQHSNVLETDLSNFRLLTVTEFKIGFQKLKSQTITYSNKFQADIKTCRFDQIDRNSFVESILSVFNKCALVKKKFIWAKDAHFMKKLA